MLQCEGGVCGYPLKSCSAKCSRNGDCVFVEDSSGDTLSHCFTNDTSCSAVCSCYDGFEGMMCDLTDADMLARQSSREVMIEALFELLNDELLTADETLVGITASLSSLGSHHTELTSSACNLLLNMSDALLNSASDTGVSPNDMQGILDVLDSCMVVFANEEVNGRRLQSDVSGGGATLDKFLACVANSMVVGQQAEF